LAPTYTESISALRASSKLGPHPHLSKILESTSQPDNNFD
jgi:hypothetical protein